MSSRFAVLIAAILLGPAAGCGTTAASGGDDTTGADAGSGSGHPVQLGDRYLMYYETGGFVFPGSTPVCGDPISFGGWTSLLAPTPLDFSTTWPANLDTYRVIAFGFLGSGTASQGLTSAQQQALTTWLHAGGTALFITDINYDTPSTTANTVLNATMQSMGVGITVDGPDASPYYYGLPLDQTQPLGAGVMPLACGAVTYAHVTAPAVLVDATPDAAGAGVLATQAIGAGRVVVLSDSTCVSDYTYASGTPPQFADCALGSFADASLGAFLRNLGK